MVTVIVIQMMLTPSLVAAVGIVELFEWRFDDIARECELFLGPKGFDAVQVSPVAESPQNENISYFDRYEPISYIIKSRSGDENEFEDMCHRCRKAGISIYVDVVINNMSKHDSNNLSEQSIVKGLAGSEADLRRKNYPAVPYKAEHFNQCNGTICTRIVTDNASWQRNSEYMGRHDLDQSQPYVRQRIAEFLNRLIALGASGFYVSHAKYIWPEDLKAIYSQLNDTIFDQQRPFIYHEYENGRVALKWLSNYGTAWMLLPSENVISFIDDKNTQRTGIFSYREPSAKAYKMAIAFTLAWGYGTPRIMSSYRFSQAGDTFGPPRYENGSTIHVEPFPSTCTYGWICEHRWYQTFGMIDFANAAQGTNVTNFWHNDNNQISFCRGDAAFIVFNMEDDDLFQRFQTCLPQGLYCDVATGYKLGNYCSGRTVSVDYDGTADVYIGADADDGFLAIHRNSRVDRL
ncbi:alpha-amylase [Nesidiocoris tenuis]|uniref:Alpha-amylase n=1 Tax=Nesidiocoris tenuis TaxID=355587 RepID=A0ABN7B9G7_9HEMI|nr:alpha-amylase [Nesidiocoris tenuis]